VQGVCKHVQFRRHFRHAPPLIHKLLRLLQNFPFQRMFTSA
jgi:hypothetical protein